MSDKMTLQQIEYMAAQLTPAERLKLVARICEQLSAVAQSDEEKARRERLVQVDAWMAECDSVAESIEGDFDSAEDIRQIREERASRL
ncbi:MAG: hypothetical protein ACUVV0_12750 [Anaerolineae bacterium]